MHAVRPLTWCSKSRSSSTHASHARATTSTRQSRREPACHCLSCFSSGQCEDDLLALSLKRSKTEIKTLSLDRSFTQVPLVTALTGGAVSIPHFNSKTLPLQLRDIMSPGQVCGSEIEDLRFIPLCKDQLTSPFNVSTPLTLLASAPHSYCRRGR